MRHGCNGSFKADSVALFGGAASGIISPNCATWTWDGLHWTLRQDFGPSAWTQVAETGLPARFGHPMAYDNQRKRTVLFGGFGGAGAITAISYAER